MAEWSRGEDADIEKDNRRAYKGYGDGPEGLQYEVELCNVSLGFCIEEFVTYSHAYVLVCLIQGLVVLGLHRLLGLTTPWANEPYKRLPSPQLVQTPGPR